MASPSEFPEQTRVLKAPESMPEVTPLPVLLTADTMLPGRVACISMWQLSPEELAEVKRTGVVYLAVLTAAQPPVFIGTTLQDCLEVCAQ